MHRTARLSRLAQLIIPLVIAISCDELRESPPAAPEPVPPPAPSQFDIVGHWEASSEQGRRVAFDVKDDGMLTKGWLELHHDCDFGRKRLHLDGFKAEVVSSTFISSLNWSIDDEGTTYTGKLTISGRFEGNAIVRGGFINSVEDVERWGQPIDAVCPTVNVQFEGNKEP